MASDDLRLNTLERFRKSKSGLTLEVHSHCEVPAGCGGAVLRWRRPGAPIGLTMFKHISGNVEGFFLDGEPFKEQRMTVPPGTHVLSFVVDDPGNEGIVLMRMTMSPNLSTAKRPRFLSGTNGTWRATTSAPPDDWRTPGFDEAQFIPLVERDVPEPAGKTRWSWESLKKEARGLGLPAPETHGWRKWLGSAPRIERVWIRCTFGIDDEGFA